MLNMQHVNLQLVDEMLVNCRYVLKNLGRDPDTDNRAMFQLNMLLLIRMRLIKPIRDQGDYGLLKVNYLFGEYYYALSDIYTYSLVQDAKLASKLLLPKRSLYCVMYDGDKNAVFVVYCSPYKTLSKAIDTTDYVDLQICIACLEYLRIMLLHTRTTKVK
jgi:hypothetical protein